MSNSFELSSGQRRRMLIQMSGAPGSGKSTIARLLAQPLGQAVVVDHDVSKSALLGALDEEDPTSMLKEIAKMAWAVDWAFLESLMRQRQNVIFDSTCLYDEVIEKGVNLARTYGYVYAYVECQVGDIDVLDTRLRSRVSAKSQRTSVSSPVLGTSQSREEALGQFKTWMEEPFRPKSDEVDIVIVDSTGEPSKCVEEIMRKLTASLDRTYLPLTPTHTET
jgi:predicted kinase